MDYITKTSTEGQVTFSKSGEVIVLGMYFK